MNLVSQIFAQGNCENNCGSGTLQEYWNGQVDCVCTLDCAGYGSACCNFYDVCFDNPSNLEFNDFIGTWNGNITNDQTWSYDDPISIIIDSDGSYLVINNPGGHLVSSLYPGTEEVIYNSSTNILTFRWVQYYHYACGGACYTGVTFQVMDYVDGNLTLFYNNGSGPAPQANSLFLSLEDSSDLLGDLNQDNNIDILDVIILVNHILSPATVVLDGADINSDSVINILDVISLVNIVLIN